MQEQQLLLAAIEQRRAKVVVWGCGLVGLTNVFYSALAGFECLGIDANEQRVRNILEGRCMPVSDREVFEQAQSEEIQARVSVRTDWAQALSSPASMIHLLCIPTENQGEPYDTPLRDVIQKLAQRPHDFGPFLIIIESTVVPVWIQEIVVAELQRQHYQVGKDVFVGVAPRRDLFGDPAFSLRTSHRVLGGECSATNVLLGAFYKTFCDCLVIARDSKHAMMSKLIENAYRYLEITLCNQLLLSCSSGYDLTHILALAGSKWNMQQYHPSLGIGGYCIPMASRYLGQDLARREQTLPSLLSQAHQFNTTYPGLMVAALSLKHHAIASVAILGVSYIPNIAVSHATLATSYAKLFQEQGLSVGIHDPHVSEEILSSQFPDATLLSYPEDLRRYDMVVLLTNHDFYRQTATTAASYLPPTCSILDNFGTWRVLAGNASYHYLEIGTFPEEK